MTKATRYRMTRRSEIFDRDTSNLFAIMSDHRVKMVNLTERLAIEKRDKWYPLGTVVRQQPEELPSDSHPGWQRLETAIASA